jgi:GT2 family glycosyltransferase
MMNECSVVILNRYPELASALLESIRKTHNPMPRIVVVRDRHQNEWDGVFHADGKVPFIFARNANIGMEVFPLTDIVLINDDCTMVEDDMIWKLRNRAYRYKECGLMSPLIDGGVGNSLQSWDHRKSEWFNLPDDIGIKGTVCFPCVYIKRATIEKVGLLDEEMTGYGFDDDDYCIRCLKSGCLPMITRLFRVKHGDGGGELRRGENWSCSFAREEDHKENFAYFAKKYNLQKN